jgi:hypothetical protein
MSALDAYRQDERKLQHLSRGAMTSRIGDSQPILGATIQIQFAIDVAGGPHHG